jgi:hypothetical protein
MYNGTRVAAQARFRSALSISQNSTKASMILGLDLSSYQRGADLVVAARGGAP